MKAHKFLTGNYLFKKTIFGMVLYVEVEYLTPEGIWPYGKKFVKANQADIASLNIKHLE